MRKLAPMSLYRAVCILQDIRSEFKKKKEKLTVEQLASILHKNYFIIEKENCLSMFGLGVTPEDVESAVDGSIDLSSASMHSDVTDMSARNKQRIKEDIEDIMATVEDSEEYGGCEDEIRELFISEAARAASIIE